MKTDTLLCILRALSLHLLHSFLHIRKRWREARTLSCPQQTSSAWGGGTDAPNPSESHRLRPCAFWRCCSVGRPPLASCCRTRSHPHPAPIYIGAQTAEQRHCVYLAGPLWATGSHVKWPRTLYPTRHGATWVGTRPSRFQAPGLHDPGLHGPGFQHSRFQHPWLQASCLQGSRFHHTGFQPSWLQSSWLQPSGISSNCRGKTRHAVEGRGAAGSMGVSPLPPLPGG